MTAVILTTGEAARRAGLSGEYLRQLAKAGKLSASRTTSGQYLFEESVIMRFIQEREAAQESTANAA